MLTLIQEGLDLGGKDKPGQVSSSDDKGGGEEQKSETISIMAVPLHIKKEACTTTSFRSTASSYLRTSSTSSQRKRQRLAPLAVVEVLRRIRNEDLRDPFNEHDAKILETFATVGATALSNAKMREDAEKTRKKGTLVSEVLSVLSHSKGTNSLILAIMGKIRDVMNVERCTVFVLVSSATTATKRSASTHRNISFEQDPNQKLLWTTASVDTEKITVPVGEGICGHVAQTGEVLMIDDAYQDVRFNQHIDRATGFRTRSILCVPVYDTSQAPPVLAGVMQVINKRDGDFDLDDVDMLKDFAS